MFVICGNDVGIAALLAFTLQPRVDNLLIHGIAPRVGAHPPIEHCAKFCVVHVSYFLSAVMIASRATHGALNRPVIRSKPLMRTRCLMRFDLLRHSIDLSHMLVQWWPFGCVSCRDLRCRLACVSRYLLG
jgi:hypothetical protein